MKKNIFVFLKNIQKRQKLQIYAEKGDRIRLDKIVPTYKIPVENSSIFIVTDIPSRSVRSLRGSVVIFDPDYKIQSFSYISDTGVDNPLDNRDAIMDSYLKNGYVVCNIGMYSYEQIRKVVTMLEDLLQFNEYKGVEGIKQEK